MTENRVAAILAAIDGLTECGREIIEREWQMFTTVENRGGKATCQLNPREFCLTRAGQVLSWPEELQSSWLDDLRAAESCGRNLMTEKYARMMASTHPEEYVQIAESLPVLSAERQALIEELVSQVVDWAQETAETYPAIAAQGRPIHTSEDSWGRTSIETYARGEISTYGEATLLCAQSYYKACRERGSNLQQLADEQLALLHGFSSLAAAEEACAATLAKKREQQL